MSEFRTRSDRDSFSEEAQKRWYYYCKTDDPTYPDFLNQMKQNDRGNGEFSENVAWPSGPFANHSYCLVYDPPGDWQETFTTPQQARKAHQAGVPRCVLQAHDIALQRVEGVGLVSRDGWYDPASLN